MGVVVSWATAIQRATSLFINSHSSIILLKDVLRTGVFFVVFFFDKNYVSEESNTRTNDNNSTTRHTHDATTDRVFVSPRSAPREVVCATSEAC